MSRSDRELRLLVAAFGDPGHAFPAIALARELGLRGHDVLVETWERWREPVEAEGLAFTGAQEYTVYPPPGPDTPDGQTAAAAARALARLMDDFEPDLVVSDILTLAPTLAAEVAGVPHATLIPHVYPVQQPGMPMYSLGLRPPRTAVGRLGWRATGPLLAMGLRRGRDELNETRARLGLGPIERFHGGISELLAIVATFPQLEYPREWPAHVQVTGPLFFELPGEEVALPEGDGPLVLIAPSTSQDPECELLRVALDGLADEPVRVLATTNRHRPERPIEVPGERGAGRLDALLAGDAGGGRGDLPRRARDGGEGAGGGDAAARLPLGRGHGRERGARGVVGRRAVGAAAAAVAARRSGSRRGGCWVSRGSLRGRGRSPLGRRRTTVRQPPRTWSRRRPETRRAGSRRLWTSVASRLRGSDSNRHTAH